MGTLSDELLERTDAIVARWYDAWKKSRHPHDELSEAALKDNLAVQLRLIGEQLKELRTAECTEDMWKVSERLDPEERVKQDIPIEEVVQEYRLAVSTIREWVQERNIDVSFMEYSYFHDALFELTAESVRRYARHLAENVRRQRAEYLAGVMHQLRSPLAALSTGVELLSRESGAKLANVERLRRNAQRLRSLIDGMLRLERFRPEEMPLHPEEMQLAELVRDVIDESSADAMRKGLRLEARVDPSCRVTVDRSLFFDALGNLVQNAVKFTKQGAVSVELVTCGDAVVLRVRDSGPGIPKERLPTLFKEIQPGAEGGLGIGLRIANHAAMAQGGHLEVESEVGKGSTFALHIPPVVQPRSEGAPAR